MKYINGNLCLEYKITEWSIRHFADAIIVTVSGFSFMCVFFFFPIETVRGCGVLGVRVFVCYIHPIFLRLHSPVVYLLLRKQDRLTLQNEKMVLLHSATGSSLIYITFPYEWFLTWCLTASEKMPLSITGKHCRLLMWKVSWIILKPEYYFGRWCINCGHPQKHDVTAEKHVMTEMVNTP